jgi:3-dehydroquinate synthase
MNRIHISLGDGGYDINIGNGLLEKADEYFNLERRIFIVTDSGVPREYAEKIAAKAKDAKIYTVEAGESSKSIQTLETLLYKMLEFNMTRSDAAIAVGGGVVGDLTGFAASMYMRGIDFYNVPTTLLSQVDSSIGGKTAVNLGKTKNIVGAFYQPKAVLIDTDTLKTLSKRHFSAGIAEVIKMATTSDEELFELLESEGIRGDNVEDVIARSLMIKKSVVEQDEKESGLRRILNFGHTFGHGIEAVTGLYHGECVSLGMIPLCSAKIRNRVKDLLKKNGLPTEYGGDIDSALSYSVHDKKMINGKLEVILVDSIGSFRTEKMTADEFSVFIKSNLK